MRIVRKRKRHEFEVDGARFYSDRNFAGVGVAGDIATACATGRGKNQSLELLQAVITGWDGIEDQDGKPLDFRTALLEHLPPEAAVELAGQIVALYEEEAARTETELGESTSGAAS